MYTPSNTLKGTGIMKVIDRRQVNSSSAKSPTGTNDLGKPYTRTVASSQLGGGKSFAQQLYASVKPTTSSVPSPVDQNVRTTNQTTAPVLRSINQSPAYTAQSSVPPSGSFITSSESQGTRSANISHRTQSYQPSPPHQAQRANRSMTVTASSPPQMAYPSPPGTARSPQQSFSHPESPSLTRQPGRTQSPLTTVASPQASYPLTPVSPPTFTSQSPQSNNTPPPAIRAPRSVSTTTTTTTTRSVASPASRSLGANMTQGFGYVSNLDDM
jgi:hypothetical protein